MPDDDDSEYDGYVCDECGSPMDEPTEDGPTQCEDCGGWNLA